MRMVFAATLAGLMAAGLPTAWAQSAADFNPTRQQLDRWLKQYPAADADRDGVLTREEAAAYRQQLQQRSRSSAEGDRGFRKEFAFATMSDGVKIALAIGFPSGFDEAQDGRPWPAVMEMHGYPDSTAPQSPSAFGDHYVTIRASLRGAGASGGRIRAIGRRNALDGYEIIENWIVQQPWSNGRVALHGHSWGGLTGFMIATTNPPHLRAVAVSGLFDDVYRDIGRIGGIRNSGFPVDWMVNLYKPTGPFDSGEAARQQRGLSRAEYQGIVASRPPWELEQGILWNSLNGQQWNPAFAESSPGGFASGIRAPIHIMHAYQDEQTGPSGAWLWAYLPDDVPKRLVLSNGDHGAVSHFAPERRAWLDYWTLDDRRDDAADFANAERAVQIYFETPRDAHELPEPYVAGDFPLPDTIWTRYYLRGDATLSAQPPTGDEEVSADTYRVEGGKPDDELDGVYYQLSFDQPTAICGPVAVHLSAICSTIDTDFFVVLADVNPDGRIQLLQRGLLRASHREVDREASITVAADGEDLLVRPRHTHQQVKPVTPNQVHDYDIEVFPLGHVFRTGHRLVLTVSQPPVGDPVTRHHDGRSAYQYESHMPPGTVAILHDRAHPSHIVLPVLPRLPVLADKPPRPGQQSGIFEIEKPALYRQPRETR